MPAPMRFLLAALLALAAVGCRPPEPVAVYSVPKEPTTKAPPPAEIDLPAEDGVRMLVAVVPTGDGYFWAVRFLAAVSVVDQYEADFNTFVDSLKLPAASRDKPTFTIPKGWREGQAPSAMAAGLRVATVHTGPRGKPVEMYISTPIKDDLLGNVNRWRTQFVGLPPTTEAELKAQLKERTVDGKTVAVVDLRGPGAADPGGGMKPPFAGK